MRLVTSPAWSKATSIALTFGLLAINLFSLDGETVSSGNAAGESAPVADEPFAKPLPPTPSGLHAIRKDNVTVELTWGGSLNPAPTGGFHEFVVFRAANDNPWEIIKRTTASNYDDTDAAIENDYRYKVAVRHCLALNDPGLTMSVGGPSNEVRANWSPALLRAGATDYFAEPLPEGYFTVSEFLPNLTGWLDGPTEYTLPGPFDTVVGIPPESPSTWDMYGEQVGWFRRGTPLTASGYVHSVGVYRSLYVSIVPGFDWSGLVPSPAYQFGESPDYPCSITLASQFAIYDGKVTGDSLLGFDEANNPVAQFLPLGESRTIQVETFPKVANVDYVFGLYADDNVEFEPSGVIQEATPVEAIASGEERETSMWIPATRSYMTINVHSKRTLNIGIYYVAVRDFPFDDAVGRIVRSRPSPLNEDLIEIQLNAIFGNQINVFFHVENVPGSAGQVDYHTGLGTTSVTIDDTYRPDQICDFLTESAKFTTKADEDSYEISVFVWPIGYMGYNRSDPPTDMLRPLTKFAGMAFIPGNCVFVWDIASVGAIAHEIGHSLGLKHAFQTETGYGSDQIPDNPRERLMGYDRTDFRLIKAERDIVRKRARFLLGETTDP